MVNYSNKLFYEARTKKQRIYSPVSKIFLNTTPQYAFIKFIMFSI